LHYRLQKVPPFFKTDDDYFVNHPKLTPSTLCSFQCLILGGTPESQIDDRMLARIDPNVA